MRCNDVFRIFCKFDTSFKGIINPNKVAKASSDVLENLEWSIGCFTSSLSALLFHFEFWATSV